MAAEMDGQPVYEVEDAARFVFANGKAAIEYIGGDGPFFVTLPEEAALQMIYRGLLTGGKTVAAKLDGMDLSRDQLTQHLVLSLVFEGGGKMNVLLNERQEEQIGNPPAFPPRRTPRIQ